jgi:hypothetical protein
MKPLNTRERDTAIIANDLFSKGSPEWRIAEYASKRDWTDQQFSNFLDKLTCLPEEVKFVIHTHFRDIRKGVCHDKAKAYGEQLQRWLGRA